MTQQPWQDPTHQRPSPQYAPHGQQPGYNPSGAYPYQARHNPYQAQPPAHDGTGPGWGMKIIIAVTFAVLLEIVLYAFGLFTISVVTGFDSYGGLAGYLNLVLFTPTGLMYLFLRLIALAGIYLFFTFGPPKFNTFGRQLLSALIAHTIVRLTTTTLSMIPVLSYLSPEAISSILLGIPPGMIISVLIGLVVGLIFRRHWRRRRSGPSTTRPNAPGSQPPGANRATGPYAR